MVSKDKQSKDKRDQAAFAQSSYQAVVKLRQGSGKDRQGMEVKAKGLKA